MRTTTRITITGLALLAAVGLAGCAGSNNAAEPTATKTVTTTPQPSPSDTPSATATPSTPATTGTGGSGTGSGSGTGTGAVAACTTANLTGSFSNDGGGAAGSVYMGLVLTNKGAACTIQGWPGVSFVGKGNGTQIGAAASFDRSTSHATVTLATGQSATATLRVVQAGNVPSEDCGLVPAQGFRVYPPGQKASLYIAQAGSACSKTGSNAHLLSVGAFHK